MSQVITSDSVSSYESDEDEESDSSDDICARADKIVRENDRQLRDAARNSGMTVKQLEDSWWAAEAAARKKVDSIMASKNLAPIEWREGVSAQLLLVNMNRK